MSAGLGLAREVHEFSSGTRTVTTAGTAVPLLTVHLMVYAVPIGVDTYPDDAAVMTVGLHVLIDTFGSRTESDK